MNIKLPISMGLSLVITLTACGFINSGSPPSVSTELAPIDQPVLSPTSLPAPSPTVPPTSELPDDPFQPLSVSAPDCSYGGEFKAIEALDRYTVRFTLCAPDPAFLVKIAFPTFAIQPDEWLEATGGGGQILEKPVGTGPFMLGEWVRGQELDLEAFVDYWGEPKAQFSNLIFRWQPDSQQRLLQVMAGMVDGADNVGPEYFDQIASDSNLNLVVRPPMNVAYLGINNTVSPFDREEVRRAVAMAIDRDRLVQVAFPAGYQVASYFTPCSIPLACGGDSWYAYDPAAARELLAQAGYPYGFQVDLYYRGDSYGYLPWPDRVASELSRQLRANLNIDVRPIAVESGAFLAAVDAGQASGLFLLGWGADYPDPADFLVPHFGPGAPPAFGNGFPDLVEALQKSESAQGEDRGADFAAANSAIKAHVPVVPLAHGGWDFQESLGVVFRSAVQGAHAGFFGNEAFNRLALPGKTTFVWLQSAEPTSLYCADEVDPQSWLACMQVTETLYRYEPGGAAPQPLLAEICTPDDSLTVWDCKLRRGVRFHDSSFLDANDVALSWIVQWDAANSLHHGDTGAFTYFKLLWGNFLNGN